MMPMYSLVDVNLDLNGLQQSRHSTSANSVPQKNTLSMKHGSPHLRKRLQTLSQKSGNVKSGVVHRKETKLRDFKLYVVKPGDSAAAIATALGVTLGALRSANPEGLREVNLLQVGQQLKVPASGKNMICLIIPRLIYVMMNTTAGLCSPQHSATFAAVSYLPSLLLMFGSLFAGCPYSTASEPICCAT
jgi:LysM repeat protein